MASSDTSSTSRFAFLRIARLPQRNTFSAAEVRQRLRLDEAADPRTKAVHQAAARTAIWSGLLSDKVAADLGRAGRCLPSIVFWYRMGVPADEIGQRVSHFGGAWDAERAVTVAAELIAHILNSPGLRELAA
ncbi:MAG TPA: hypothetical protein VGQ62_11350 [Chloroflexota bacterium]|nr:hypothetical protein [Chloroflexota bacterium]